MGVIDPFAIIKIPKGQIDVVTMEEIKDGTLMVDFHDEREKYHRYYTEDTYRKLNNNKNPFNDRVIENADVKYYIAELDASLPVQEAGRRKRTLRRSGRKTRRRI
jgi:predicted ABC-class ATPase